MRAALTSRSVESLKPKGTRQEIPDSLLPGLYLLVQPSGSRSWAVRYRVHGRSKKYTIGAWPAIDLKSARVLGAAALRAAAGGGDPAGEKRAARQSKADSVEAVAAEFFAVH